MPILILQTLFLRRVLICNSNETNSKMLQSDVIVDKVSSNLVGRDVLLATKCIRHL